MSKFRRDGRDRDVQTAVVSFYLIELLLQYLYLSRPYRDFWSIRLKLGVETPSYSPSSLWDEANCPVRVLRDRRSRGRILSYHG